MIAGGIAQKLVKETSQHAIRTLHPHMRAYLDNHIGIHAYMYTSENIFMHVHIIIHVTCPLSSSQIYLHTHMHTYTQHLAKEDIPDHELARGHRFFCPHPVSTFALKAPRSGVAPADRVTDLHMEPSRGPQTIDFVKDCF